MKTILLQYTVKINGIEVGGFTIDNGTDFEEFFNRCYSCLEFDWFTESSAIADNPKYIPNFNTDCFTIGIYNDDEIVDEFKFRREQCGAYNWLFLWKVVRNGIENYERGGDSN